MSDNGVPEGFERCKLSLKEDGLTDAVEGYAYIRFNVNSTDIVIEEQSGLELIHEGDPGWNEEHHNCGWQGCGFGNHVVKRITLEEITDASS